MKSKQIQGSGEPEVEVAKPTSRADGFGDHFTDADIYGQIDQSQRKMPWWLVLMVGVVILLAVVLNAPFLGGKGGDPMALVSGTGSGSFLDAGMIAALLYVGLGFCAIFWYTCWRKGA